MATVDSPKDRVWLLSPLRRALGRLKSSVDVIDVANEDTLDDVCIDARTAYSAYLSVVANFDHARAVNVRAIVKHSTEQTCLALTAAKNVLPEKSEHRKSVSGKLEALRVYAREHFKIEFT